MKEKKIGYKNNNLDFCWREQNQQTLMCFLGVFGVCKREKCVEKPYKGKKKSRKCVLLLVWGMPGAIYSPDTNFEVAALVGLPASNLLWLGWSWKPWKYLDFLFLKRYGTRKSNDRIKSYGSRKLEVHQSVCYPGFHDISAILSPISTHE